MDTLSKKLDYPKDSSQLFAALSALKQNPSLKILLDSCSALRSNTQSKDLIATEPEYIFETRGTNYQLFDANYQEIESGENANEKLLQLEASYSGQILGYFGYHCQDEYYRIPRHQNEDNLIPDICLGFYPWFIEVNHAQACCTLHYRKDLQGINEVIEQVNHASLSNKKNTDNKTRQYSSNLNQAQYKEAFDIIKQHILDGDCYQVNLAQRFECDFQGSSWQHFLNLRQKSPAPYSAYLSTPHGDILSFSPESFLHIDHSGSITSRPIKGTRKRDNNNKTDSELKQALKDSIKDKAENLMIVDLIRNDLSKSAQLNTVTVDELFRIESFSNVHHMVSVVKAQKKSDISPIEVLLNCFPGGSITGAPKKSAMEIIRKLEPHSRQIYCGAIGYKNSIGELEFNIAIRSILICNNKLYCWGGGGLVSDSECESEYQESLNKINNLINLNLEDLP